MQPFLKARRVLALTMLAGLLMGFALACGEINDNTGNQSTPPTEIAAASPTTHVITVPPEIATEIVAGGPFQTTDEAEAIVGYPLLRPSPSLVLPGGESGIVDVFAEVGLPRVRQGYVLVSAGEYVDFTQSPATYPMGNLPGGTTKHRFGDYEGELWEHEGQISFRFPTGASIQGVAIIAEVGAFARVTRDDIEHFVESLSF